MDVDMPHQQSIFDQPTFQTTIRDIKAAMNKAAKQSGLSRETILDRMNELASRYGIRLVKRTNKPLDFATLEKWLNPQERNHIPAHNDILIFCASIDTTLPLAALCGVIGARVIDREEARLLEWAKLYHQQKEGRKRLNRLEKEINLR
jgi:hypothetical protein